ncbi:hypothetical protein ACWEV4_23945 [Streptomyces sp. NPDC003860]
MAWDEWEQLKAGAAERRSTGMQLNSAGAAGAVKSSRQAWTTAGESIGSLRKGIGTAVGKLADGQAGLGKTDGCLSAAAQREVYASWQRYAQDVGKRCESLRSIMERVGRDQLATDEAVKAEIDRVRGAYADVDPVSCVPSTR